RAREGNALARSQRRTRQHQEGGGLRGYRGRVKVSRGGVRCLRARKRSIAILPARTRPRIALFSRKAGENDEPGTFEYFRAPDARAGVRTTQDVYRLTR